MSAHRFGDADRLLLLHVRLQAQRYTLFGLITDKVRIHPWQSRLALGHLQPYAPREVWVSIPASFNVSVTLDVTDCWENKIAAIMEHKSQVVDPKELEERLRSRHTEDSTPEAPRYAERFHVVKLR